MRCKFYSASALVAVAASALLWAAPEAHASVLRIDVTPESTARAKQTPSAMTLDVQVEARALNDYVIVRIAMPADQPALEHHLRTEVWRLDDDKGAGLTVPLQFKRDDKGVLHAEWSVKANQLDRMVVVVRCGPHAPLAETMYWIEPKRWLAPK